MKKLFGVKKKGGGKADEPPPPSLQEASETMGGSISKIQEKVKQCNRELAQVKNAIKKSGPAGKRMYMQRAQNILKKKKMYEQQLGHYQNQQFNVDMLHFQTEQIQMTIDTSKAMKAGIQAQKVQLKQIDMNELQDLQDDLMDMQDDQQEINEIMGSNFATPDMDDAELMDQLAALDEVELDDDFGLDLPAAGGQDKAPKIPDAPPAAPVANKKGDEQELADLMN